MSAYSEANRDVVRLLVSLLSHIFNSITKEKNNFIYKGFQPAGEIFQIKAYLRFQVSGFAASGDLGYKIRF